MSGADALTKGREAFERRAWADAYAQLTAADEAAPLGLADLELVAASASLIGKDERSGELWTRGHTECLRSSDVPRAARFAFWAALILAVRGEFARAGGWLTRAQRLLDEGCVDCAERGLILVLVARVQLGRGDVGSAHDTALQALAVGNRFGDPELLVFARLIVGQSLAAKGNAAEAATLFDEAMVAATVGEVSPIAVGVVYCAVISVSLSQFDVQRAREWTSALSRWCMPQAELVPFRGQCLVHRVEVMRLSGAWSQALAEAEQACTWLSRRAEETERSAGEGVVSSFTYPIGAVYRELGEAYRVRGDLERAAESYREASRHGCSPEPGLALLRLAQGRPTVAESAIRRLIGQPQRARVRAASLAACVEIMIAVHDLATARSSAEALAAMTETRDAPFLRALSSQAIGGVVLAEGDARAA